MSGPLNSPAQRSKALDMLRGIAILLVLFSHMGTPSTGSPESLPIWMAVLRRGGWTGVDLFFVLSGFLISGLLFMEQSNYGTISFGRFFIRRGFKIFPAYYAMLLITSALFLAMPGPVQINNLPGPSWPWLIYVQNYVTIPTGHSWGHTWSLAVEEHFYVFLPLILIILARASKDKKDPFRLIPILFLAIAVTCLALRLHRKIVFPELGSDVFFRASHIRVDSLFFGVMLRYIHHYHSHMFEQIMQKIPQRSLTLIGLALISPAYLFDLETTPHLSTVGLVLIYIGAGLILAALINERPNKNPLIRCLAFIGKYSYSIFLWHIPARSIFFKGLIHFKATAYFNPYTIVSDPVQNFSVFLAISILTGIVMSKLIEMPFLKIRDRLYPSRSVSRMI